MGGETYVSPEMKSRVNAILDTCYFLGTIPIGKKKISKYKKELTWDKHILIKKNLFFLVGDIKDSIKLLQKITDQSTQCFID